MGKLAGKVALISGTGSGIGRAAAVEFAAEGALVSGCDVHEQNAAETVRLVTDAGGTMISFAPVDLSAAEGARRWVEATVQAFGGIDILYNNASAMRNTPFVDDPDGPIPDLLAQRFPLGTFGHPEDVAKLAAFLASDDAGYINGAEIIIDGGVTAMAG